MKNAAFERGSLDHLQRKKENSVIHCIVCSVAKGLSVHACQFSIDGSGRVGPGTSFGQILRRKLPSKII